MHECSYQGGTAWAEPSILRLQAFSQQNKKLSLDNLLELRGALLSSTGTVCFPWALTTGTQHFCSILQLCSEHLTHRKLETKGAALRLENIKGAAAVCFVSLHKCSVMEDYWHSGLCCVFLPLSSLLQPHNSSFLQLKLQDRQSSRSVNNDIFFLQKKKLLQACTVLHHLPLGGMFCMGKLWWVVVEFVCVHFQKQTYCRSTDSSGGFWWEGAPALCSTPEPGEREAEELLLILWNYATLLRSLSRKKAASSEQKRVFFFFRFIEVYSKDKTDETHSATLILSQMFEVTCVSTCVWK